MLTESTGWSEYSGRELGEHFASMFADAISERDRRIADLEFALEVKEREGDLLRARIDELSGVVGREAA